jgi:hypothetical protein
MKEFERFHKALQLIRRLPFGTQDCCEFCKREFTHELTKPFNPGKRIFAVWTALKLVVRLQKHQVCQECEGEASWADFEELVMKYLPAAHEFKFKIWER